MNRKKNALLFLTAIFSTALTFSCAAKPSPATARPIVSPPIGIHTIEGKLKNQVDTLEEDMPRAFSEKFIIPTNAEKDAFFKIASFIEEGNIDQAMQTAASKQYELLWYTDGNDENANNFMLREDLSPPRGWGLYLFRAGANSNIIIEAPHPLADEGSPLVAVDIYRALNARALLIAGAHRDANSDGSADTSHATQTVFQSVHESLTQNILNTTDTVIVLQIHGFSSGKHPKYPQVIIGYGGANLGVFAQNKNKNIAQEISNALNAEGISTGMCNGDEWKDLCGGSNAQAGAMTNGIFIHLEMDESIREEDGNLIKALMTVFAQQ